jgi:hypothetical protein
VVGSVRVTWSAGESRSAGVALSVSVTSIALSGVPSCWWSALFCAGCGGSERGGTERGGAGSLTG